MASGIDGLRASLQERQRQALSQSTGVDERLFGFSRDLFEHANEHRDVFQAMVGKRSGAVIQQLLHKMLVDLTRVEVKAIAARMDAGSVPMEAVGSIRWRRIIRIADVVGEREDADAC